MASSVQDVQLSESRVQEIVDVSTAFAVLNGVAVRPGKGDVKGTAEAAPYALFPTPVPRGTLQQAKATMVHSNRLMHRVATDHQFLMQCFQHLIHLDPFITRLWDIYTKCRESGTKQPIHLGLFRNDFMMDCKEQVAQGELARPDQLALKQIEFNSIAAGTGGLLQQLVKQHRLALNLSGKEFSDKEIPENIPATRFCGALIRAWELYNKPESVIIMVVSDCERYAIDQHWMELNVVAQNPRVRVLRKRFDEINAQGSLDNDGRLTIDGDEVAVIFLRHGYSPDHYPTEMEWNVRLMLEMSKAIKCPSVQHQLMGSKKVQQELARPGALERFIKDQEVVDMLRATFAGQHSLDMGQEGDNAVQLALASPDKFVLKPSREGGGNNLYSAQLTEYLKEHGKSVERSTYILMERIYPWQTKNYLIRAGTPVVLSDVVTELGIYGVYIGSDEEELENYECGHMMRTKRVGTEEGGILVGCAVLDSPYVY